VGVHHRIPKKVSFVCVWNDLIVAAQHCDSHRVSHKLPALSPIVESVLILRVVLHNTFDCHHHVRGKSIVFVGLVNDEWNVLMTTCSSWGNVFDELHEGKILLSHDPPLVIQGVLIDTSAVFLADWQQPVQQ